MGLTQSCYSLERRFEFAKTSRILLVLVLQGIESPVRCCKVLADLSNAGIQLINCSLHNILPSVGLKGIAVFVALPQEALSCACGSTDAKALKLEG